MTHVWEVGDEFVIDDIAAFALHRGKRGRIVADCECPAMSRYPEGLCLHRQRQKNAGTLIGRYYQPKDDGTPWYVVLTGNNMQYVPNVIEEDPL